jgi:hypothetical protein
MVDKPVKRRTQKPPAATRWAPAFVERVRLRALRHALWMRTLWSADGNLSAQGLAISHGEVDRILRQRAELAHAQQEFYKRDEAARRLAAAIKRADHAADSDDSWIRLRNEFGLTAPEMDLLAMAVALEDDPMLGRVYGYLHDNANASYPTPWLAAQLFEWEDLSAPARESALVRWHLARPLEGAANPWAIASGWLADVQVANWIWRRRQDGAGGERRE